MRLLILSDLHLEAGVSYTVPRQLEFDAVVLAGDINSPGARGVHWAARDSTFDGRPVVYVAGNHEFYDSEYHQQLNEMREAAVGTNVHVLHRDSVAIRGVRFLGTTLWTDFALPVTNEAGPADYEEEADVARALESANRRVFDFRCIQIADHSIPRRQGDDVKRRLLTAQDTLAMHHVDRDWLRRGLLVGHPGSTVVVTHHAPNRRSVASKYRGDWVTPSFVSDLPRSFFAGESMWVEGRKTVVGGPRLWVHGHTHSPFDYQIGDCRVVSNPRGYRRGDGSWENAQFDAGLVVDVPVGGDLDEGER